MDRRIGIHLVDVVRRILGVSRKMCVENALVVARLGQKEITLLIIRGVFLSLSKVTITENLLFRMFTLVAEAFGGHTATEV